MGRPKALVPVDGTPMAGRVAAALAAAGAGAVVVVGGTPDVGERLGLDVVVDDRPGEGPLAGTATALGWARRWATDRGLDPASTVVLVAPCDQPDLTADVLGELVGALAADPAAAVAVVRTPDGRRHPLPAAWRVDQAAGLDALVAGGARRADAPLSLVAVATVAAPAALLADLDTPAQVASRQRGGTVDCADPSDLEVTVPVPEIDIAEAARRREAGVPIVDVRQLAEYVEGHVPGAPLVTLDTVPERLDAFPTEGEVLIICRSGARSARAAEFLREQGIEAINIAGGTMAWIEAGLPVVTGDQAGA